MTAEKAIELSRWLKENQALENVTIELSGLLAKRGFPKQIARMAVKEWGNLAPALIRMNPYRLMKFPGVGFKSADAMYLDLGHNPGRLKRQALSACHALQQSNGDTWHYQEVPRRAVLGSVGGSDVNPKKALRLATRAGLLASIYTDGVNGEIDSFGDVAYYASNRDANAEIRLSKRIAELCGQESLWSNPDLGNCDAHQKEQLTKSLRGSVGILGGAPGTGKTYTTAELVKWLGKKFGFDQIAIAAPTGKAAVRCTEAMSQAGIPNRAITIHGLLEAEVSKSGVFHFARKASNPLEYKFILIDESSMVDLALADKLFDAVPKGGHVLLVGDINQLLPVGGGAPLRDFISAGLPYGELTEIKRNSGGIVEACADIRDGRQFNHGDNLLSLNGESVTHAVYAAAEQCKLHPTEVQVLSAVNERTLFSRKEVNKELQASLNSMNKPKEARHFWLRDKVVCLKNGQYRLHGEPGSGVDLEDSESLVRVANGELGQVIRIEKKRMLVSLTAPNRQVWVTVGQASQWDLAYALSVHKSQGSEFPCVVVCIDQTTAASRVMDRAWVYTAISRAKQRCYLLGSMAKLQAACRKDRIKQRKTFLAERIVQRVKRKTIGGKHATSSEEESCSEESSETKNDNKESGTSRSTGSKDHATWSKEDQRA